MQRSIVAGCVLGLGASAAGAPALAQSIQQAQEGGQPNFIALGAGFTSDYLGSDDIQPIPFGGAKISVPGADLYWRGLGLRADILGPLTKGRFIGGIDGRYQFGRDDVESDAVNALPTIDETFEVGGFLGYRIVGIAGPRDSITLAVDALADAGGEHDGYTISPNVTYATPVSDRLMVNTTLSTEYGSANFMETYFGVTPAGAEASGLSAFAAEEGFYQVGVSGGLTYTLTERWGVFGLISYRRLIADAADSPIVDVEGSANQFIGGVSLSYRF